MIVKFLVPGPIKGKGRGRATIRGGHATIYTPADTRHYEAEVRFYAAEQMGARPLIEDAVEITLVARFMPPASASKKRRAAMLAGEIRPTVKPDLDNIVKAAADAMNRVVYRDDAQIVTARIAKLYSETPGLTVIVKTLDYQSLEQTT